MNQIILIRKKIICNWEKRTRTKIKNKREKRRNEKDDTFEKKNTFEKTNKTFDEKDEIIRDRFEKTNKKSLRWRRFSIVKRHDKKFKNENNNRCVNIILDI